MPHARRDRQYLIIILYITDHGLRNFGKGRYVPRSPLANRQIPAEPRFGSDLRPALKKPAPPRLRFADRGTSVAPSARSRIVQAVEAALRRVPRLAYNRNAALSQ